MKNLEKWGIILLTLALFEIWKITSFKFCFTGFAGWNLSLKNFSWHPIKICAYKDVTTLNPHIFHFLRRIWYYKCVGGSTLLFRHFLVLFFLYLNLPLGNLIWWLKVLTFKHFCLCFIYLHAQLELTMWLYILCQWDSLMCTEQLIYLLSFATELEFW